MPTPFDPQVLLNAPLMANLATSSDDGPCNAPVWFIWEDDRLWMLGSNTSRSVHRLEKDARCAVEITKFDNKVGILLHLGLRGEATIEPMNAGRFRRLLQKYLGTDEADWNAWFIETVARIDDPAGRFIVLEPQTTFTNNVSFFQTGPDFAWP